MNDPATDRACLLVEKGLVDLWPVCGHKNRRGWPSDADRPDAAPDPSFAAETLSETPMSEHINRLLDIMARLRDPKTGCPWDVEQTFATIVPHTIEEAYEVAETIEQGDMAALKDELGDLLFQVVFYAQMAKEDGLFDFEEVAGAVADKMIHRHPHVFSGAKIDTAEAQTSAWEALKAEERKSDRGGEADHSALDGVINALPALTRAEKLQKRAARVGFDWPDALRVLDKLDEEVGEITHEIDNGGDPERLKDEVGDVLFVAVNLARKLGIDGETALRHANTKFEKRFRRMEREVAGQGRRMNDVPLDDLEAVWQRVKTDI